MKLGFSTLERAMLSAWGGCESGNKWPEARFAIEVRSHEIHEDMEIKRVADKVKCSRQQKPKKGLTITLERRDDCKTCPD